MPAPWALLANLLSGVPTSYVDQSDNTNTNLNDPVSRGVFDERLRKPGRNIFRLEASYGTW